MSTSGSNEQLEDVSSESAHHSTAVEANSTLPSAEETTGNETNLEATAKPPSLLQELADALVGAAAVYGMADVRSLVRASRNSDTPEPLQMSGGSELLRKAMELPISRSEMMQILLHNLELLRKECITAELYLSLLEKSGCANSLSNDVQPSSRDDDATQADVGSATDVPPSVSVTVFDDENSAKQLVYYIAIDE
jgi:hypothetical protein